MNAKLHLLGAGRAATALARLLQQRGFQIGKVVCTSLESAGSAVDVIGAGHPSTEPAAALEAGVTTLWGVPDRDIAPLATSLAQQPGMLTDAVLLHLSGSLTSEALHPLRERGASLGSLHPMRAFADRQQPPSSLQGVFFGIEGMSAAAQRASELVQALQGVALPVTTATKPLYHAAASAASNGLVAVYDLAETLERAAGASPELAREALLTLMAGTLENLRAHGSPRALTGPIERGEVEVIEGHRQAMLEQAPASWPLYSALAVSLVDVACRKGSLDQEAARQLLASLEPPA